jgi:hypothetical protein
VVATPHKASVSCVKLDNSGLEAGDSSKNHWRVLSASDDFTLVLSDITSSSSSTAMRLTSHTRALTSTSLLGETQAISTGKDGTLRIWDISPSTSATSGKQLGMLRSSGDVSIMSLAVSRSGSIAALALQSGHFDLVSITSRTTLFSSSTPTPGFEHTKRGSLDAIALQSISDSEGKYVLATGSRNGILSFYVCVVRDDGISVTSIGNCVRNGAGISDIKFIPSLTNSKPPISPRPITTHP